VVHLTARQTSPDTSMDHTGLAPELQTAARCPDLTNGSLYFTQEAEVCTLHKMWVPWVSILRPGKPRTPPALNPPRRQAQRSLAPRFSVG
jgi:hypothetical protein